MGPAPPPAPSLQGFLVPTACWGPGTCTPGSHSWRGWSQGPPERECAGEGLLSKAQGPNPCWHDVPRQGQVVQMEPSCGVAAPWGSRPHPGSVPAGIMLGAEASGSWVDQQGLGP